MDVEPLPLPVDPAPASTPPPVPAVPAAPSAPLAPVPARPAGSSSHSATRKFGAKWELKYAVAVSERDAAGKPTRAICLMCQAFDKEALVGAKRKRTSRVRNFTAPWRPDNMKRHMEQQHPMRWEEYQKLGDNDKRSFFTSSRAVKEDQVLPLSGDAVVLPSELTVPQAVSAAASQSRAFLLDQDVVNDLIGDVLFEVTSSDRRNAWNVPVTFTLQEIGIEHDTDQVDANESRFVARVGSLLQFNTCLKYVAMGISLPQVVTMFKQTAEEIGVDSTLCSSSFTQQQLATLCRVACAVNLQTIKDTLRGVWAFAVALERGDGAGSPYLDVRVRFEQGGQLHDYHLVAVPIREEMPQACEHQCDAVVKCLDVVASSWRSKLIGVSANGSASQMTLCTRVLVNRFKSECLASIFCDWGVVEQFEVVVQKAFKALCNAQFTSILTKLTGHLRRQRALIQNMNGETCPKFEIGHWRSVAKVLRWLGEKRARLEEYVKETSCSPGMEWWVTVLAVNSIMDRVNIAMAQLRGPITQNSPRHENCLAKLVTDLSEMTGASGPLTASSHTVRTQNSFEIGDFTLSPNATLSYLKEQGSYAIESLNYLIASFPASCQAAVDATAHFALSIISQTHRIIANNIENGHIVSVANANVPLRTALPPFLPQVLCRMRNHEFVTEVQLQRVRLLQHYTVDQIEQIEDQHRSLRTAYQLEDHVSQQLNALPDTASFATAWKDGRFGGKDCRLLRDFCGAIAAAACDPHVSATETEFSLINWRRSPFGLSLIDFSLEAILHAQQYRALSRLRE